MTKPLREPRRDLLAQIACLQDANHPKVCVFIPSGRSEIGAADYPKDCYIVHRQDGTFLTYNELLAYNLWQIHGDLTEDQLASILDYPQSKTQLNPRDIVVVQVKTRDGAVVQECCISPDKQQEALAHFERYRPTGGTIEIWSPAEVLARRIRELEGCCRAN